MRAPGAAWGLFALESAMDELAYKFQMDPLELRLKNYAEKDLNSGKRFSSKELRELSAGSRAFRLGPPTGRAAIDARWRTTHRLGHRDRRLGILATAGGCKGHIVRGWKTHRSQRYRRYRNRHLY